MSRSVLHVALFLIAATLVQLAALPAFAAVVPKRPSDLRTAGGNVSSPACPGGVGKVVGYQYNSDGTSGAFSIPSGKVFIVTSWEWDIQGATPSEIQGVTLAVDPNNGSLPALMSRSFSQTNSAGNASGIVDMPVGAAVKSGTLLCFANHGTTAFITVRGFLANDR